MPPIPFVTEGAFGSQRRDLAADFTIPTEDGDWTFSEQFTGCDSYVFVSDDRTVSPLNDDPLVYQAADILQLLEKSPPNVHYFFVPTSSRSERIDDFLENTRAALEDAFGRAPEEQVEALRDRIHLVTDGRRELQEWISEAMLEPDEGFAIDRFQRVREIGQLADVQRYSAALNNAGAWPWESNLAYIAHPPQYYNFERAREARLAGTDWTTLYMLYDEDVPTTGRNTVDVTFPDAETMAGFDTMLVDLTHICDPSSQEFGNCDAWDAIQDLWLCDADDPTDCSTEIARYITTYHREGRWLADASPMLPFFREGGTHRLQLRGARVGHDVSLRLLLGNEGKDRVPLNIAPLWRGRSFNEQYDASQLPIDVSIPADAKTVELVVLISGHGQGGTDNCSEFCDHQHYFALGGETFSVTHPEIGDREGCLNQIGEGTVPNQYGTWWFSRSSWCPGKEVEPWVFDVTAQVTPGQTATLSYTTNYGDVTGGGIVLSSYLVFWK